jgi:hypothetical protein
MVVEEGFPARILKASSSDWSRLPGSLASSDDPRSSAHQ